MADKKIRGTSPNISEMNLAFYSSMDPDLPIPQNEEERQALLKLWEAAKPKFVKPKFGVPLIFGTGGSVDNNFDFKKLWEDGLES